MKPRTANFAAVRHHRAEHEIARGAELGVNLKIERKCAFRHLDVEECLAFHREIVRPYW